MKRHYGPSPYPLPKGERVSEGREGRVSGWSYTLSAIGRESRVSEGTDTLSPIGGEGRVKGQVREHLPRYARRLRREQTDAERKLWSRLRDHRLCGARFRRQHPIGPFIADFCCTEAKLIIELDGGQHALRQHGDQVRTKFLESQGYALLRFWDNDVFTNSEAILERIAESLRGAGSRPSPCPLPKGERVQRGPR